MSYVESIEMKYNETRALFHCQTGDQYWAAEEDGAWWLSFLPGEPSEGPFADVAAVETWLNTEE